MKIYVRYFSWNFILKIFEGIAVAAILAKVSSSESPEELLKLKQSGLLVNFESLLSEYGKETGMMGDYAFGSLILLERASFVLTPQG